MPLAHSPASDTGILVLTFLCGFALATLVFWPLLHRVRQAGGTERGAGRSRSEGRHALNRRAEGSSVPAPAGEPNHPAAPARAADPATAVPATAVPAARSAPSQEWATSVPGPSGAESSEALSTAEPAGPAPQVADTPQAGPTAESLPATEPDEHPDEPENTSAPAQRDQEPSDLPPLPSDLFRQHHAAHFQRARQRVARLRQSMTNDPAR